MARTRKISNHYEGPGDAPRGVRRKRQNSTPSVDLTKQSLDPSQGSTSVNGNASTSPAPEHDASNGRNKRIKRVVVDDHQQLNQELQESVSQHETSDNVRVAIDTQVKERGRFSEPLPTVEQESTTPSATPRPSTQPPSGLTPHLNRISVHPTKPSRHARFSLPAQLHNGQATSGHELKEVQFNPLRTVLDARVKRRLRRSHLSEEVNEFEAHQKEDVRTQQEIEMLRRQVSEKDNRVKELMLEMELHRQMGIDLHDDNDKNNDMQAEIDRLRKEIADHEAEGIFPRSERNISGDVDMDGRGIEDDNNLDLVDPEDLNISQEDMHVQPHPLGFYSSVSSQSKITDSQALSEAATQISLPDHSHEAAITGFENAIIALERELAEIRPTLKNLSIELKGLGFGGQEAASNVIVQSIRCSFREARARLELLIPGGAENIENSALLNALTDHIQGLLAELKEKTELAEQHNQMEKIFSSQNSGLLDRLAEVDSRNTTLEQQWTELDIENEERQKIIVELEDELATMHNAMNERDKDITEKDIKIHGLEDEVNDQTISIQRLQQAIDKYRTDLSNYESLILQMEEKHKANVAQMEEEHASTVGDLQSQLQTEIEDRKFAQAESDKKSTFINELEARIDSTDNQLDFLRSQLTRLEEHVEIEKANREIAEDELSERKAFITDLENRIEQIEESSQQLSTQLENLRTLAESERRQREAAEADLDDCNTQISELDAKLHDAGIQANELRSKLFEVQMEKDSSISVIREAASRREMESKADLDDERVRRQTAEREVDERNATIADLEPRLERLEQSLEDLNEEKDQLVASRDKEIEDLTASLESARQQFMLLQQSSTLQITTLESTITDLTNKIAEQETTISTLQNEAIATAEEHQNIIAQKDEKIADLSNELTSARDEIAQLNEQKASLETRVDSEALELLNIENAHDKEAQALKSIIATREAEIESLTQTSKDREAEYTSSLAEKQQEVQNLVILGEARAENIAALSAQIEELKKKFMEQSQASRDTINSMKDEMRKALERADSLVAGFIDTNAEASRIVEKMHVEGVSLHTNGNGANLHRIAVGRVEKLKQSVRVEKNGRGRGRRKFDSGIGVESEEEEADEGVNGLMLVSH